jgi:hypothetical protein
VEEPKIQTNRLRFQDVDQSASLPQASAITGYTVLKAPKGTAKPKYIAKGDTTSILQLFGAPSSSYPSLQEAIDFNQLYGLWISAPGGSVTAPVLTSTYGGAYITTLGSLEPFSNVTEGGDGTPTIDFYARLTAGNTASPYSTGSASPTYGTSTVSVTLLDNTYFNASGTRKITFSYPRTDGTTASVDMTISGTDIVAINPTGGLSVTVGSITVGTTTTTLLINTNAVYQEIGGIFPLKFTDATSFDYYGGTTLNTYLTANTSKIVVSWEHNIQSTIIMAIYQSSTRSVAGSFTVKNIDVAINIYNTYTTSFTFSGSSGTAGTVLINGQTLAITSISSASTVATEVYTLLTTTQAGLVPGYTVTNPSSGVVAITNLSSSIALPTLTIGTLVGFTIASAKVGVGTAVVNPNYNTMTFSYYEMAYASTSYVTTMKVSTDFNKVDGYGQNIFVETMLDGNAFIGAKVYKNFYDTDTGVTWGTNILSTLQGTRAVSNASFLTAQLPTVMQTGWSQASGPEYQDTKIFFDAECLPDITTTMANLRSNNYPFSTFVTGIKIPNAIPTTNSELQAAIVDFQTTRATYPNITGLTYYCNEFLMKETYNGTSYWGIPIGSVSGMLAQIMELRLGGVAPMFTNENNLGGQISKNVKRQKFNFDATSLDTLDAIGLNPIILDNFYGLMITSQKTAQSPLNLSDGSFLGHQMSFDLFKDEVKNGVMIPQIGKAIDPAHMKLRREQTQIILNKRIIGPQAIWAEGKVLVEEVNTADTKAQNIFVIKVRVKVYPFSEYVLLIFNNVAQTSTVN